MTADAETEIAEGAAARLQQDPFISDFFIALPRFASRESPDIGEELSGLAELIGGLEKALAVAVHVVEGERTRSWVLDAGPDGCRVIDQPVRSPDLELVLDAATWTRVASGELPLLEAFARGRMRVRGDVREAQRLVEGLRMTQSST